MLNSAREMSFFLDRCSQIWAANRRSRKADQRTTSTSSRPARVRRPPASGEQGRQMKLRTPAIRRDRPTVRGSPALRARSMSAGSVPAELPAQNHRCDAKDHARPRKYFEQNTFSKRGVQVQPKLQRVVWDHLAKEGPVDVVFPPPSRSGSALSTALRSSNTASMQRR